MILDKAPETIRVFTMDWVADGYGGGEAPEVTSGFTDARAFIVPTGFAGAGWAINSRAASQGWVDTARLTVILKWKPELDKLGEWSRVEARGQYWTVVEQPRLWVTRRVRYVTALLELLGDAP